MAKYSFWLKAQSILNIDLQIRRIVDVPFKKRAGPRLRIVLSGLKDVSRLEVFKPDNTRLRVFLFWYRSTHSSTAI